jgi:PhzF family phenazine biosynthesis protein
MTRRFFTLDVFTDTPLAGNPLAVVLDSEGLEDARMQAIAAEFNLSETVFVFEPRNPINTASVKIFTPARELPFAGHPTVGTAALLAYVRSPDVLAAQDLTIVLEERVGDIVCVVEHRAGHEIAAHFELPKLPARLDTGPPSRAAIAEASALRPRTSASTGMSPAFTAPARLICSFRFVRSRRSAAPGPAPCPGPVKTVQPPTSTPKKWSSRDRPITRGCSAGVGA